MTTKLLVVGDAGKDTGFERVVRGVCEHLYDTGKYTIVQRGIQYYEERATRKYPWTVKSWNGSAEDPMGTLNFTSWLEEDEPELLFFVDDLWNITNYVSYKPRELPAVAYFPVDTPNMKWLYAFAAGSCAEVATYTQFAAREMSASVRDALDYVWGSQAMDSVRDAKVGVLEIPNGPMLLEARVDRLNRLQNPGNWNVIPHGLDKDVFSPRDKATARENWNLPKDAFIVLNVNTNQFRKRLDTTVRAFAELYRHRKDALLVFYCAGGDFNGWDLLQLAHYYGVASRVLPLHHHVGKLTDEQLCWLYSAADVQMNTGGGEAWGLTSIEGAACGVPQLVPDWSATRELWADYGVLLPVSDWRHEPKYINTAHAIVDVKGTGEILCRLADDPAELARLQERSLAQAERQLPWSEIGAAFDILLQRALHDPQPVSMSFPEVFASREPGVRSELRPII